MLRDKDDYLVSQYGDSEKRIEAIAKGNVRIWPPRLPDGIAITESKLEAAVESKRVNREVSNANKE